MFLILQILKKSLPIYIFRYNLLLFKVLRLLSNSKTISNLSENDPDLLKNIFPDKVIFFGTKHVWNDYRLETRPDVYSSHVCKEQDSSSMLFNSHNKSFYFHYSPAAFF